MTMMMIFQINDGNEKENERENYEDETNEGVKFYHP